MDLCDRREIQALLERHGFHFSKAMGQNFLIESWVPRDIADSCGADEGAGVLEIGPGIGPLTQQLARRAGKVVSVELDARLYPVLRETMRGADNFTLIEGDAMKLDFAQVVQEHFAGLRPILCANLPYNITTPVLTKCVESRCFDSLTVLIQKEVAQRICAEAGTAEYGAFTVGIALSAAVSHLFGEYPMFPYFVTCTAALGCCITVLVLFIDSDNIWGERKEKHRQVEEKSDGDESDVSEGPGRWKLACNDICCRYDLSPRERDVFMLIAKGRNAEYVQNALYISGHTAKTHISNIYKKLDIHSVQELLDLVEAEKAEKEKLTPQR